MGTIFGTSGNDSLSGTDSSDVFDVSQGGDDTVIAGVFDVIKFGGALTGQDSVQGGTISIDGDYSAGILVNTKGSYFSLGVNHNYRLTFAPGASTSGISGADLTNGHWIAIDASAIPDHITLFGGAGNDTLIGSPDHPADFFGGAGNDSLSGQSSLLGGLGNDTISATGGTADGQDGDDLIVARSSAELRGGTGDDTLIADGATNGTLLGGDGADRFIIRTIPGSAGYDIKIGDFAFGETVDLSALGGFTFIGSQPFTGVAKQFNYVWIHEQTRIQFDTNGDKIADAYVDIEGEQTLKETAAGSRVLHLTPDITPPNLVSTQPSDNDTLAVVGSAIALHFDENMRAGSGTIEVHNGDGSLFKAIDVHDPSVSFNEGNVWTDDLGSGPNASYYVTIAPGVLEDLAGNPYAGFTSPTSLNFTTAAQQPVYPPASQVSTSAVNGFAVDKDIEFVFSRPIALNGDGFINIYRNADLIESISTADQSHIAIVGNTLVLNPSLALPYGTPISIAATSGAFRDFAGFTANSPFVSFTPVAAPEVTVRPLLVSTSPADDTANVSVNSALTITFDRPVTFGAGQFELRRSNGALVQAIGVADSTQVSYSGNTVTIHPVVPLAPGVTYSVLFPSGAIRDAATLNSFNGITSVNAFNFTTSGAPDVSAPQLASFSPSGNAVASGSDIVLNFSEPVQRGSGDIQIHYSDGSLFASIPVANASQVKVLGSTVTIDPQFELPAASGFYVTLPSGAVLDYAGNPFAGISTATALSFATPRPPDTTAPVLRMANPADDTSNVKANTNIVLGFSEAVKAGSGNILLRKGADDSIAQTIAVTDASQVSIAGALVTINPGHDLDPATAYYVSWAPGVFADLANNGVSGLTSPAALNFTTRALPDVIAPLLVSASPSDNATNVQPGSSIVLTFNEPVKPGSDGNIFIHSSVDDRVVDTISLSNRLGFSISGNTATITTGSLAYNSAYYVTMAPSLITDLAGNGFTGLSGKFDLNFVTVAAPDTEAPQFLTASPYTSEVDVKTDANVVLTFDEPIRAGSGSINIHSLTDGSTVSFDVNDAAHVQFVGNSVTVNPSSDLHPGSHYSVTIDPNSIQDFAGHAATIPSWSPVIFQTGPGMTINLLFDQSPGSLPGEMISGLVFATKYFSSRFADPITINLHIGIGEVHGHPLDADAIAASMAVPDVYTYEEVRAALQADALWNDDARALLSLPEDDPTFGGTFLLMPAEAAALGLPGHGPVEGYIGFNNTLLFDYNPDNGIDPGKYDFQAAVAHELSEVMGRVIWGFVDAYTILDLFDFAHPGQRNLDLFDFGYFSLDNGVTVLKFFNDSPSGDFGDWDSSTIDAFNAFGKRGQINPVSEADLITMDVLGYDRVQFAAQAGLRLVGFSPAHDRFEVPTSSDISLMFNQPVAAGAGHITIRRMSDSTAVADFAATDTSHVHITGSTVTIDPSFDLVGQTAYYVTVDADAITYNGGRLYSGFRSNDVLNFTTADGAFPLLTSTTPTDDETGVPLLGTLSMTFNAAVKPGSGNIVIHRTSDSVTATLSVTDTGHVSFSGNTVTVNSPFLLGSGTNYYVTVDAGAIQNLAGNNFAGISSSTAFNFTTADTVPPQLVGMSPADDSSNVPVDANLVFTFNEPVQGSAASTFVITRSDGIFVASYSGNDASHVSISGSVVTLNPSTDLAFGTGYYVTVGSGAIKDLAGNSFNGISSPSVFNFTTAPPAPEVAVQGNGVNIADGDSTPTSGDFTDFGSTAQGASAISRTFTVLNSGTSPLTTSGLTLPAGYSLAEGLSSSIAPGASDTFTVQLISATAGAFAGDITFVTDDADENPFNFRVLGTIAAVSVLETQGATTLGTALNRFYLRDSLGAGPSLKFSGADFTAGQFGAWTPIGAEKAGSTYQIAWKNGGADQYTAWNVDANGNFLSNAVGTVPGSDSSLQSMEIFFQQDLNSDGRIGLPPAIPIESSGITTLATANNLFYLQDNLGAGPTLRFQGANFIAGQFGAWTPIGAEKTSGGYEVAWKFGSGDQYTLWNTDANGNYTTNASGTVSGSDAALRSAETLFQQDLNGDSHIGAPPAAPIESFGATKLAAAGNLFFLQDSTGVGPALKFQGANFVAGQFGAWTPIGAEKTSGGYEIAWKFGNADQYTLWNTDANGNYVSNASATVPGADAGLKSAETLFQQDLNGDEHVGASTESSGGSVTTAIESFGATKLGTAGNLFYLQDGTGAGPVLKFQGANFVAGQFGAWTPIGAEKTSGGYEVAWKFGGDDQYTVWNTDANGSYTTNLVGAVPGSDSTLRSAETLFQQDLNGDGQIGLAQLVIEALGATKLVSSSNLFYLQNSAGAGPSLKYQGADFVAGQFGAWAPIGVEATANGYEVAWKFGAADQFTLWNTDANGNFVSNVIGAVAGSDHTLQGAETLFQQDINNDGHLGLFLA